MSTIARMIGWVRFSTGVTNLWESVGVGPQDHPVAKISGGSRTLSSATSAVSWSVKNLGGGPLYVRPGGGSVTSPTNGSIIDPGSWETYATEGCGQPPVIHCNGDGNAVNVEVLVWLAEVST